MPPARTTSSDQGRTFVPSSRKPRRAAPSEQELPAPLRDLVERCSQALHALSGPSGSRHDIHALRSSLSDICALTSPSAGVLKAVNKVVDAGDHLGEVAASASCLLEGPDLRGERLQAAEASLRALAHTLVDARPSRIAVSLGRDW